MVRMMVRLLVSGDKRVRVTVGVHSPVFSAGRYADVCAAHQNIKTHIVTYGRFGFCLLGTVGGMAELPLESSSRMRAALGSFSFYLATSIWLSVTFTPNSRKECFRRFSA